MAGLWFLWSILICSIPLAIVYKKVSKLKWQLFLLLCCWIIMSLIPYMPSKTYSVWLFPYFVGGFLFHKYQNNINKKILQLKYISLPIFPILLLFFHRRDYIYTSGINPFKSEYGVVTQIGINCYRWVIGIVGCIFIITIVSWCINKSKNIGYSWLARTLSKIGQNTLQIYVMQRLFLETILSGIFSKIVNNIGYNPLSKNIIIYNFIWTPLLCIIIVAVLMKVSNIIKVKLPNINKVIFGN
jgi:hypothetical protein